MEPDLENALEEVRIRIDRELALRYGVRPEVISGTVASALRGRRLPRFRDGEKEIEIGVQFPEEDRQGIGKLASLQLAVRVGHADPSGSGGRPVDQPGLRRHPAPDRRTVLNIQLNTTWDIAGAAAGAGLRG